MSMSVSIARWMVMVMPIELLPQPLRWWARRVRTFCLSDGVALLVLGLGIIARGVSYVPAAQGRSVSHPAEGALPMSVWAIIWIGVGVVCLVAAVWHDSAVAAVALGLGVGRNLLWAGSFHCRVGGWHDVARVGQRCRVPVRGRAGAVVHMAW